MELADILAEQAVLTCTGVKTKHQLFEQLASTAAGLTGRPAGELLAAIENREELGSTGLGNGIAIPHGKVAGLKQVCAVFARLDEPIEFDALDDLPVDIVMLLLAPTGSGADHLKALSRVARVLRNEDLMDQLRGLQSSAAIYQALTAPVAAHRAA
ncbi:PTS sugar transporter subunit IIA [uncultured Devosia sp.]|uniref:PTS sugar transporter subunit IIA n=1 Tax=uncultured Devosia sp. TaxID=211434 RepID=UPI0035CB206C